jgi:tRNA(Ile)-lysidine synthase
MSSRRNLLFDPPIGGDWLFLKDKLLGVAFSGGKDSLALLHYMKINEQELNARIQAIHINHGLRGDESERDEAFCRTYCQDHDIPFKARAANVRESSLMKERGVEYAARYLRYSILKEEKAAAGYDYILTAHTMDDKIETFFTDLMTGASVFTLGGIEAFGADFVRPLLSVTRDMVEEFLAFHRLSPVYDSSNGDLRYVRNLVRSNMPFLSSMKDAALRIQTESAMLSAWFAERTSGAVKRCGDDFVVLDRELFEQMSAVEQGFLLGRWVSRLCRGGKVHSDAVLKALERRDSLRLSLPMGFVCELSPSEIFIFPKLWVKPFSYIKASGVLTLSIPDRKITAVFPKKLCDRRLVVRSRADGDRFRGKKLKKLFSDIKLPLILRDRAVVVAEDGGDILWAEHIGSRGEDYDIKLREDPR